MADLENYYRELVAGTRRTIADRLLLAFLTVFGLLFA